MKKLTYYVILSVSFLFTFKGSAQVLYKDSLDIVYVNNQLKEVVFTNNFNHFNGYLITRKDFNIKSEIRKAEKNDLNLFFRSAKNQVEMMASEYLKTIRKAANKSRDVESFKNFMNREIPELANQFKKNQLIEKLYALVRKNTFNGKIDVLPSVL